MCVCFNCENTYHANANQIKKNTRTFILVNKTDETLLKTDGF
jgi:hypothetical protein